MVKVDSPALTCSVRGFGGVGVREKAPFRGLILLGGHFVQVLLGDFQPLFGLFDGLFGGVDGLGE